MKRVLCPTLPRLGSPVDLPESEANHVIKVLRLRDGEHLQAMDGKGHAVIGVLRIWGSRTCLELAEDQSELKTIRTPAQGSDTSTVTLEMAVIKGDAMEWVIEKSVELGVRYFVPVLTAHTVIQVSKKGPEAFQERWQKIADQALKQCGRLESMQVSLPIDLEELLSTAPASESEPRLWFDEAGRGSVDEFLPWVMDQKPSPEGFRLLIGPEGGWSDSEREFLTRSIQSSFQRLSLSPLVLRAESAAISAISLATASLRAIKSGKLTTTQ